MGSESSPDTRQILEALDTSALRSKPFIDRLELMGFELEFPFHGMLRLNGPRGPVAWWPGPDGSIATCAAFHQGHHFTVGTVILLQSALTTDDPRLSATSVVLAAAGVTLSGVTLPSSLVLSIQERARAAARRSVSDHVMFIVANQISSANVAASTGLTDMCDELDMMDIVLSLEDVYGVSIDGLEDWNPDGTSDIRTVGDLVALVEPQLSRARP